MNKSREKHVMDRMRSLTAEEMAVSKDMEKMSLHFIENSDNKKKEKIVDFGKMRKDRITRSQPYWDDGRRDQGPRLPLFGRKKRYPLRFTTNFIVNSIIFSIVAAIAIGGAFGIILLKMITNDDSSSIVNNQNENGTQVEENNSPVTSGELANSPIPSLQLFVIQEGAYSTIDKGMEVAQSLQRENLPATISENSELVYLFMGVSNSRENGEQLTTFFQELGKEPYMKAYEVSQPSRLVTEQWNDFMVQGIAWMNQAAQISSEKIVDSSIQEAEIQDILNKGNAWKTSFHALQLENSENDLLLFAENWINNYREVHTLIENQGVTDKVAWEMQQAVLQAMIQYEELVNRIAQASQ